MKERAADTCPESEEAPELIHRRQQTITLLCRFQALSFRHSVRASTLPTRLHVFLYYIGPTHRSSAASRFACL